MIYQSYKHDQANTQSSDSELRPTFKDVLEAAGAAFMLLVVAQSLPLNKAKQFVQCDLSFGSDLFAATYTRPLFTTFTAPLSAEDLQLAPNWQQAMFVVKDPERYIEYLCKEQKAKNKQFIDAILSNQDFLTFFQNLPEERKKNNLSIILHWYSEETQNPEQKEWSKRINGLSLSTNIDLIGACAYPIRKSGDKQAKSVSCTYNANFTRQGIESALSLLTRSFERGSACG